MNLASSPFLGRVPPPSPYASKMPAETHELARGAVFLYELRPNLHYVQITGHLDLEGAEHLMAFTRAALERSPSFDYFHDWAGMLSYESAARTALTRFTIEHARALDRIVFLVRSRLVAMGVATANLATRPLGVALQSHTDRAHFERAFRKRVG